MRIVSLLPSTTEILFAIGAGEEVVGVTFECDFPPEARSRRVVSTSMLTEGLTPGEIDAEVRARMAAGEDLYRLDAGALGDLQPDLVVTQDLCAVCAVDVTTVAEALGHLGCDGRVLTVDPGTLAEVLESIVTIGGAAERDENARRVRGALQTRLDQVAAAVAGRRPPRVAVLEWTDPLFSAGHWVPDMITAAGGVLGPRALRGALRPHLIGRSRGRRGGDRGRRALRVQPGGGPKVGGRPRGRPRAPHRSGRVGR